MVENFVAEDADHVKGLLRGDRVYQNIAVYTNEVFRVQDAVFILVRRDHVSIFSHALDLS